MSLHLTTLNEVMQGPVALSLSEDLNKSNVPSEIASFLLQLFRLSRNRSCNVGKEDEVEPRLASMASDFLDSFVRNSFQCIDTASNDDYYAWDWIMDCHESAKPDVAVHLLSKHDRDRKKEKASSQLPTLWSYFVLRTILAASVDCPATSETTCVLNYITSPEAFNQLLKGVCVTTSLLNYAF